MMPTRVPSARPGLTRRGHDRPEAASSPWTGLDGTSAADDRERIDRELAGFLADARRKYAENPHIRPIFDRAAEFVLEGGKRLRPRLALASYRILTDPARTPPREVWAAASSLELFHAFMLAHDDLIDNSLVRRERPTLHEAIRHDAPWGGGRDGKKRAADLGLIAGDLLCALGMRMLGRAGLDDAALGRAHRLVAEMLLETGVGEALDVLYGDRPLSGLSEGPILDAYLKKTARYSVSGPLVLGAGLAGAGAKAIEALGTFGDLLGLGYQIQNDLEALDGADPREECPDLDDGKRTWLLWTAYHALDEAGRSAMEEGLSEPAGIGRRANLLRLIEASGAMEKGRSRVASLRHEAEAALRAAPLDAMQRRAFLGLAVMFGGAKTPPVELAIETVAFAPAVAEM